MAKQDKHSQTERVGNIEMRICFGKPSPESTERWERRSEAIAAWLLAEWKREHAAKRDAPKPTD